MGSIIADKQPRIAVLGAGVSGLTTALLLARTKKYHVEVLAKYMPGEYSIEYASPWAGANFAPHVISAANTREAQWDRETWTELERLAKSEPGAAVHFQELTVYMRDKDEDTPVGDWLKEMNTAGDGPWFRNLVPNYRVISKESLPAGYDSGLAYTTVCLNVPMYLAWLHSQCLNSGVTIYRRSVDHIREAFHLQDGKPADLVVNCTGLGAKTLGGVADDNMYPIRGHILLVRNSSHGEMLELSGTDDTGAEELVYVMERAGGGGTVLGGCYQPGQSDPRPDPEMTERIKRRAAAACPTLTGGKGPEALDVVEARVGLRPARKGGPRVEKEAIDLGDGSRGKVVHCYGHGGFGYQCSWGCSREVVGLVGEALADS